MSKYALKLEQLVQTDQYGDILVTIQYDGSGPKLVTANGDGIEPELKHALDTVLGLVNFSLAKGIAPSEIAEQLEAEPQDGMHLPLNDVLMVVAASLKEAPAGIEEIRPDILMEVVPEMVKEFTKGAGMAGTTMEAEAYDDGGYSNDYDEQPAAQDEDKPKAKEEAPAEENPKGSDNSEESQGGFFGGFNRRQ